MVGVVGVMSGWRMRGGGDVMHGWRVCEAWLEVRHGWSVVGVIRVIMLDDREAWLECRGVVGVM